MGRNWGVLHGKWMNVARQEWLIQAAENCDFHWSGQQNCGDLDDLGSKIRKWWKDRIFNHDKFEFVGSLPQIENCEKMTRTSWSGAIHQNWWRNWWSSANKLLDDSPICFSVDDCPKIFGTGGSQSYKQFYLFLREMGRRTCSKLVRGTSLMQL